jgi:protein O-GlcNAc transferase
MFPWFRKTPPAPVPVDERLRRASEFRDAGRLNEAERELRAALAGSQSGAAYFQLAVVLQMQNRLDAAETSYRMAIAAEPSNAEAHNGLGVVLHGLGRDTESLAAHEQALVLRPDFVDAHNNAAVALQALGRAVDAIAHYDKALALSPAHPGICFNSAAALEVLGRLDEAETRYRKALDLAPGLAIARNSLGALLRRQGRLDEAFEQFSLAVRSQPSSAPARLGLAYTLIEMNRFDQALEALDAHLAAHPEDHSAFMQRARALEQLGRIPEAHESNARAIALAPDSAEVHLRFGALYGYRGDHEQAIAHFRQAVELAPDSAPAWSGLLFSLNLAENLSPQEIYAAHREFGQRFTPAAGSDTRHSNARDPDRRLRVGYVSADFRTHSVAQFVEPVFEHHDRRSVEIFCYHAINRTDEVTERIKRHADAWREAFVLSDAALADRIRADGIDVLVDLSGHTVHNRLPAFARKPAPVQATWLGYLNTTGLPAMDWRIADPHAAPRGLLDSCHTERLVRLPVCQWCYRAPPEAPEVRERPLAPAGNIVFAAFTNPAKISNGVITSWSRLLARLPQAKLLVVGPGLNFGSEEFRQRFASNGIAAERIVVRDFRPFPEYLALHGEADIVLDTFPYSGGTTSCHALWMGVPLVTLAGETATSRGGASLLNAIGLPELVAENPDQYVRIAENLANDPIRLKDLRAGMRQRMLSSPLTDVARFTRDLEGAYRAMWRAWCERQG